MCRGKLQHFSGCFDGFFHYVHICILCSVIEEKYSGEAKIIALKRLQFKLIHEIWIYAHEVKNRKKNLFDLTLLLNENYE